jgi:glutamyl-tRNA reductase
MSVVEPQRRPAEGAWHHERVRSLLIEQLTRWCETWRQEAVQSVLARLKGKLSEADCAATEKAFSRFQNQFLHGPIRALTEETHAGAASGYTLVEALRKLFRLAD